VASPVPVANWLYIEDGKITSLRVAFDARELVRLVRVALIALLDQGIVVGERPEEEIEVPVVVDVAPGHAVPPSVLRYLIGYALLVRHVGEGDVRCPGGKRRRPASCLLDAYRTPVNSSRPRQHYSFKGRVRLTTSIPYHLLSPVRLQ
jgi:hypothetical protein